MHARVIISLTDLEIGRARSKGSLPGIPNQNTFGADQLPPRFFTLTRHCEVAPGQLRIPENLPLLRLHSLAYDVTQSYK